MFFEGEEFVSIHDFIETMCQLGKNESFSSLINELCSLVTSKYSYEGNKCLKAEAADKTRHILLRLDLVLEIFMNENIGRTITNINTLAKLNSILLREYFPTDYTCCCCPKRLKKAVARASSFSEFVKKGAVELRRFNAIKPSIQSIICLDIEGMPYFPELF